MLGSFLYHVSSATLRPGTKLRGRLEHAPHRPGIGAVESVVYCTFTFSDAVMWARALKMKAPAGTAWYVYKVWTQHVPYLESYLPKYDCDYVVPVTAGLECRIVGSVKVVRCVRNLGVLRPLSQAQMFLPFGLP